MKFRAGDLEFTASVVESSQTASPQTGNALQSLVIQFRAQKAGVHEAAVAEAFQRQSGGLFSLAESDQPEVEWRVRESNWTYVGTEPWGVNHHVWRIEQVERLACSRLDLDSVQLEPYEYTEVAGEDGAVRLAARALVTPDELEAVSRLAHIITVTRVGISDSPRTMRLDYVWGERPEGHVVVVRCQDVGEPRVTLSDVAISREDDLDDLIVLLGVNADELRQHRHARRRVTNPDAWAL